MFDIDSLRGFPIDLKHPMWSVVYLKLLASNTPVPLQVPCKLQAFVWIVIICVAIECLVNNTTSGNVGVGIQSLTKEYSLNFLW